MDPSITVDERKGRWVWWNKIFVATYNFAIFYCNEKLQNSIILFGNMAKKKLDDESNMPLNKRGIKNQ